MLLKHALGSASVGALAKTMMARRATAPGRNFMMVMMFGCDDFDEGRMFACLLVALR